MATRTGLKFVASLAVMLITLVQPAAFAAQLRAGEALLEATTSPGFRAALEAKAAGQRTHTVMLSVEPVASLPARVDGLTLSLAFAGWQLRDQWVLADAGTSTHLILVFERQAL